MKSNQIARTLVSWSGGKDSALMLHRLMSSADYEVVRLLTTLRRSDRVMAIHQVAGELIEAQAAAAGLPIEILLVGEDPGDWVTCHEEMLDRTPAEIGVAYGDLFLEDIREYRAGLHEKWGRPCHFPLWGEDTSRLARTFIDAGFRSVVTSVDTKVLDASFAGRLYDESFLKDLPEGVDPCGENGEFHSFVFDGPIFSEPVGFVQEDRVTAELGSGAHRMTMAATSLRSL